MTAEYVIRAVLRSLVLPPIGSMLLIVVGTLCASRLRRVGQALVWTGVLSLWLLSTPWGAMRLQQAVEKYPAVDLTRPTGAQAVVILSGGARTEAPEYGADVPGEDTLQRLAYGAYVARRTGLPVLVSGGVINARTSLGAIMQASLERDFQVPVRWVEAASRDTHENALFSAAILKPEQVERVLLVTSAEHMARAVAEFRTAGLEVVPAPVGMVTADWHGMMSFVPSAVAMLRSQRAIYEWLGDIVRRMRLIIA